MNQILKVEELVKVPKKDLVHYWLRGNTIALCGAGPRKRMGTYPEQAKEGIMCENCVWKATQMGYGTNGRR